MYQEYCFVNRWKVKADNRGFYHRLKDFPEQLFDDRNGDMALWPTGLIKVPVCTFHIFCTLRNTNFPLMKLRLPLEDICLQCNVFKNQFKYTLKEKKNNEDKDNDDLSKIRLGLEVNN